MAASRNPFELGAALLVAVAVVGCANRTQASQTQGVVVSTTSTESTATIRYQVSDIERSIRFYTERLAFRVGTKVGTAFADVSRGNLRLILSGPGSSGARPMPDGRRQEPGGWNRIVLTVDDLAAEIAALEKVGVHFRNEIEAGPGGKQILLDDPDGNPIELHEYPRPKAP
jgi:glyoxylase I family protein